MGRHKEPLPNEKTIIDLLRKKSAKEVSKMTGIDYFKVRNIGITNKVIRENWKWSDKEVETLLKYYDYGLAFAMNKLPNRSKWSIINKYRTLTGKRKK